MVVPIMEIAIARAPVVVVVVRVKLLMMAR